MALLCHALFRFSPLPRFAVGCLGGVHVERKKIKLSPKKGGHGHVTSYSVNIGSAEAKICGFVREDGSQAELEKVIDPDNHQIIFRLKEEPPA